MSGEMVIAVLLTRLFHLLGIQAIRPEFAFIHNIICGFLRSVHQPLMKGCHIPQHRHPPQYISIIDYTIDNGKHFLLFSCIGEYDNYK